MARCALNKRVMSRKLLIREQSALFFCELYRSRTVFVVIRDVVDSAAHGIAPHLAGIVGLQQFADGIHVPRTWVEPKVVQVGIEDYWHAVIDG